MKKRCAILKMPPASARPATGCGMDLTVGGGGDPACFARLQMAKILNYETDPFSAAPGAWFFVLGSGAGFAERSTTHEAQSTNEFGMTCESAI